MADAANSTDGEAGPTLGPSDLLGIIQRIASDLHAYCAQPPYLVDRNVCMAMLERGASILGHYPPLQTSQADASDAQSARAN